MENLDFGQSLEALSQSMSDDSTMNHTHQFHVGPGLAAQIAENKDSIGANNSLLQANKNLDLKQAESIKLNGTSIHVNLESIKNTEANVADILATLQANGEADNERAANLKYLPARFSALDKKDVDLNNALVANAMKDMKQSEKIAFLEAQLSKNQEYLTKMFSVLVNHQKMLNKIYS